MTITQRISAAVLLLVTCIPFSASAASNGVIFFRATPEYPGPESEVTLKLTSYVIDVDASFISWKVDGKEISSGNGKTAFQTTLGPLGKLVTIDALIVTPEGDTYKQTRQFRPGVVDILWRADTYVPPFYKGKALPSDTSLVRALALADFGNGESVDTIKYKWTLNRTKGIGEGTGFAVANFEAAHLDQEAYVTILAQSKDGVGAAERSLSLLSIQPDVRFYEFSPLFGVRYERALPMEVSTNGTEYTVKMVPYFISSGDREKGYLSYEWTINGSPVNFANGINEDVTLTAAGGTSNRLYLKLYNKARILQTTFGGLLINFTGNSR